MGRLEALRRAERTPASAPVARADEPSALGPRPQPALRDLVAGLDTEVPVLGGRRRRYVNLDNAATTPPFRDVLNAVNEFVEFYSSVHRGTGFKSQVSTEMYERCRRLVLEFVGADPDYHTCVFCANTTDAVNYLCCRLRPPSGRVVLSTIMEHHSNMLPWRLSGEIEHVRICTDNGSLDVTDLEAKLAELRDRVRLVAVTGASNVTGFLPPIHRIARLAHEYGALALVDGAQLVAHRRIRMGKASDPDRIDFLVFSGHKMYAPFGGGVLIGPKTVFAESEPGRAGGGNVEIVSLDEIEWAAPPEREEAGTPNLLGAIALAKAATLLSEVGFDAIADHERALTAHVLRRLARIDGLRVFGEPDPDLPYDRLGVIPILLDGMDHALLAAILSHEWGIGVRHGCFCAHPYVKTLLGVTDPEFRRLAAKIRSGDRSGLPGFVRISLALYNTEDEIDHLAGALEEIRSSGPRGSYVLDKTTGHYHLDRGGFDLGPYLPF